MAMKTLAKLLKPVLAILALGVLSSCTTTQYGGAPTNATPWGISADRFRFENKALDIQRWQYEETRRLNGLDG